MRAWRVFTWCGDLAGSGSALTLVVLLGLLLFTVAAPDAYAITAQDNGYYVEATQSSWNQLPFCNAPDCTAYSTDGAEVPNSYYGVAQMVDIQQAQDGEVYQWQAIQPDGTVLTLRKLTYFVSYNGMSQCFVWDTGQGTCNTQGHAVEWDGPQQLTGKMGGTWKIDVFDNGAFVVEHSFTLDPPVVSTLSIISPVQNQLIDLAADQNYAGTDSTCATPPDTSDYVNSVCFAAKTSTGNPVNWTVTLNYSTSAYQSTGTGTSITNTRSFQTDGAGTPVAQTYTNMGGQVTATATSTAADGSTLTQSVTFYIEGPIGGIPGPPTPTNPDDVISPVLKDLYQSSWSYNNVLLTDPYGNIPTQNLMTGIAWRETQYRQFTTPQDNPNNSDLYSGIDGKWPTENTDISGQPRGKYIGLMQVLTASDQSVDPSAWNWNQNATDAVNIYAGGSGTAEDRVEAAVRFEGCFLTGCKSTKYPSILPHTNSDKTAFNGVPADGREDDALVLYGGYTNSCGTDSACAANLLYNTPYCSGTTSTRGGNLVCSTHWQWAPNSSNSSAIPGLRYVRNNSLVSWYDATKQAGVRDDLK